jgi:hypothetical protein
VKIAMGWIWGWVRAAATSGDPVMRVQELISIGAAHDVPYTSNDGING